MNNSIMPSMVQQENRENGKRAMLGQILVSQGLITQAALDTAITEQIFLLQEAFANQTMSLSNGSRNAPSIFNAPSKDHRIEPTKDRFHLQYLT